MNGPGDHAEDPLLEELRDMFANDDPVPPLVTETAKAALGWRRLDAELAELLSDSSLEEEEALALARGAAAELRSASFSSGPLTIDVEIRGEGDDLTVLGQLSPPTQARIAVHTPDGTARAASATDAFGRFAIELPARTAFRLRVEVEGPAGPTRIETSWIAV